MKISTYKKAKTLYESINTLKTSLSEFKRMESELVPDATFTIQTHKRTHSLLNHNACKNLLKHMIIRLDEMIKGLEKEFAELKDKEDE